MRHAKVVEADGERQIERNKVAERVRWQARDAAGRDWAVQVFPAKLSQLEAAIERGIREARQYDNGACVAAGQGSGGWHLCALLEAEAKKHEYRCRTDSYTDRDSEGESIGPESLTFLVSWGPTYEEHLKGRRS